MGDSVEVKAGEGYLFRNLDARFDESGALADMETYDAIWLVRFRPFDESLIIGEGLEVRRNVVLRIAVNF